MRALKRPYRVVALGAGLAAAALLAAGCGYGGAANAGGQRPDTQSGQQLFTQSCGSCHTLADAGTNGTTGPNLDQALKGKDAAFIKQSIEDPNAEIANGYSANIMPQNYAQTLKPEQVDALVKYLAEVTK